MNRLAIATAILLMVAPVQITEARRGCCSHHGGVCGCSCCDGSPLSAKCAPYYPECSQQSISTAISDIEKATYIIVGPFGANLRSNPNSTSSILKISKGTKLKVIKKEVFKQGGTITLHNMWYKVEYKGKKGWVSEHSAEETEK